MISEVEQVRLGADVLVSEDDLEAVYDRLAKEISDALADRDPVIMPVMLGGLYLAGMLLPKLDFPLRLDYIHATRYRGELSGGELVWRVEPRAELKGRTVLVVDDILDDGQTLQGILDRLEQTGVAEVLTVMLVVKQRARSVDIQPDFMGVEVPDRYVFGCGMDYKGYWRNLPAIYAVAEGNDKEGKTC